MERLRVSAWTVIPYFDMFSINAHEGNGKSPQEPLRFPRTLLAKKCGTHRRLKSKKADRRRVSDRLSALFQNAD
ncbi:MAG: hypothetical protein IJQ81_11915 [Oscillibacter sp.]|nr:hypothetical protein [Oscillibacter sp.]